MDERRRQVDPVQLDLHQVPVRRAPRHTRSSPSPSRYGPPCAFPSVWAGQALKRRRRVVKQLRPQPLDLLGRLPGRRAPRGSDLAPCPVGLRLLTPHAASTRPPAAPAAALQTALPTVPCATLLVSPYVVAEVCWMVSSRMGAEAEANVIDAVAAGELQQLGLTGEDLRRTCELLHSYSDLHGAPGSAPPTPRPSHWPSASAFTRSPPSTSPTSPWCARTTWTTSYGSPEPECFGRRPVRHRVRTLTTAVSWPSCTTSAPAPRQPT